MIKLTSRLAASAAAVALVSAPAYAQDAEFEDEIFVTATKRTTTLQDTPVAVTVTSAETIERAEINDLIDLQSVVPSLRVNQLQTSTNTDFIIRGFGNGANNPGIEPSVGVFIDGVYRSRSAAAIGNLPNLERVEVLSGPQSTLFGKNASAGVISIVTQAPQFQTEGYVEGGIGNYGLLQGKAYVTGPVSETLAYSIGGGFQSRDGYFTRSDGGESLNDRSRYNVRGQLLFEPSDASTLRLIGEYNRIDEICCGISTVTQSPISNVLLGLSLPDQPLSNFNDPYARISFVNKTPTNELSDYGLSAQYDRDIGNAMSVTSITSYRVNALDSDIDADFTAQNSLDSNERNSDIDTFTQELRLTSNYDSAFNFQIGGFYFDETVKTDESIGYGPDLRAYLDAVTTSVGLPNVFATIEAFDPNVAPGEIFGDQVIIRERFTQKDETYSLFGTVDYDVTEALTLTGGLNYTDVSKRVTGQQTNNDTFSNLVLATNPGIQAYSFGAASASFPNFALLPPAAQGQVVAGFVSQIAGGLEAFQFQPQFLEFPNSVESGKISDDKITWSLKGAYEISDNLNVYASAATGFKASSYNLGRDSRPFAADAQDLAAGNELPNNYVPATGRNFGTRFALPEKALVYELGAKARWDWGNVNVAGFLQTLEDFQANSFVGTSFVLSNAGETQVNGVEVSGRLFPLDGFSIDYAATVLDAEYEEYLNAPGPGGVPQDLTGQTPGNIAEFSGSLGMTYEHDFASGLSGYVRGDFQYESPTLISRALSQEGQAAEAALNPLYTQLGSFPGYEEREQKVVNISAGLDTETGLGIQFWGRNIFGDDTLTTLFPGVAQFGIVNGYPTAPATYGVNVRYDF